MSNALHLKSVKNQKDIGEKVKILHAKYIKDFKIVYSRKPLQHEKDDLENLAILKITFEDILERIKMGRDHKREYLAILSRYDFMVRRIFGSKAKDAVLKKTEPESVWD